jgi:transmembrane protein
VTPAPIASLLRQPWLSLVARLALTLAYWWSGIAKAADFSGALGEASHFGLEPAWLVAASTILVQLGGSALVILGRAAWLGAGALAVFTAIATLIAHSFWTVGDPMERFHEMNTFLEHIALIGGLILAAILAEGPARV